MMSEEKLTETSEEISNIEVRANPKEPGDYPEKGKTGPTSSSNPNSNSRGRDAQSKASSAKETKDQETESEKHEQRPSNVVVLKNVLCDNKLASQEQASSPRIVGVNGSTTFPAKLHKLITNSEFNDIIRFLGDGKKWIVVNKSRFEKEVLPLFFRHSNYLSFTRSVVGWGFQRAGKATYFHELFIRDSPELCLQMNRKNAPRTYSVEAAHSGSQKFYSNEPASVRTNMHFSNNVVQEQIALNSTSYPRPYDAVASTQNLPHIAPAPSIPDGMKMNNGQYGGFNFQPHIVYQRPELNPTMPHPTPHFNYHGFPPTAFPQVYQDYLVHSHPPHSMVYAPQQGHHIPMPNSHAPPFPPSPQNQVHYDNSNNDMNKAQQQGHHIPMPNSHAPPFPPSPQNQVHYDNSNNDMNKAQCDNRMANTHGQHL